MRFSLADGDGGGGAVAGGLQPVEQSGAALGQRVDHGIADMAERKRDVLALFGQRAGDALGDFADLVGDQIADRGDVVRQIEVDAGDGVAHVLGLTDQGLALVGEPVEKIADAHFVVVVGALDRGDFVVHQRFQLGRARQRALDSVAHGGDFAADGLSDRDDLLARGILRLGQPHRHLGDGLGDQAQVLRAAEHMGEHVEEDHRHDDAAGEPDHGGDAEPRGREQGLQLTGVKIRGGEAAGGPDKGAGAGEDVGHARRAVVQGLQYLPELGTVVIGGAARRRIVRLRRLHEQIGGRRRRDLAAVALVGGGDGCRAAALGLTGGERFLDGVEGVFGQIGGFLWDIRHSVVASPLRRTIASRAVALHGLPQKRGILRCPRLGQAPLIMPARHPIGLATRKKPRR